MSVIPIGSRFGMLTVTARAGRTKWGEVTWQCSCDCGAKSVVQGKRLRSGGTRSCGCLIRQNGVVHGGKGTRLYRIWRGLIQRCERTLNRDFHRYGGAGVRVCDEWRHDFARFQSWAKNAGYSDALYIDRIDPAGNYEPRNCRWVSPKESSRNRSPVKLGIEEAREIRSFARGGATHTAIALLYGVSRSSVSMVVAGRTWV